MRRDAPGMTTRQFQYLERLARPQLGQDRAIRGTSLAQCHRRVGSIGQGRGIMGREYVFSEPDIGQIGANRMGARVEPDGASLQGKALTRWPVGGLGRRQRR